MSQKKMTCKRCKNELTWNEFDDMWTCEGCELGFN